MTVSRDPHDAFAYPPILLTAARRRAEARQDHAGTSHPSRHWRYCGALPDGCAGKADIADRSSRDGGLAALSVRHPDDDSAGHPAAPPPATPRALAASSVQGRHHGGDGLFVLLCDFGPAAGGNAGHYLHCPLAGPASWRPVSGRTDQAWCGTGGTGGICRCARDVKRRRHDHPAGQRIAPAGDRRGARLRTTLRRAIDPVARNGTAGRP